MRLLTASWILGLALCSGMVRADITVTSSLPYPTFLQYERIPLTLKVTNNSGREIVFTEEDADNQIVLRVRDMNNRIIPRTNLPLLLEKWVIPDGETSEQVFDLVQLFQVRSARSFQGLQHVVVDGDTYKGPGLTFDVVRGTEFDEIKRKRQDRVFTLIGLSRGQGDELMMRVTNKEKSITLATYFLERHLRFYPPHIKATKDGQIGTLHYLSPQQAVMCLFEKDGTPIRREYYQVSPGVPVRLHVNGEEGFMVEGGTKVGGEG